MFCLLSLGLGHGCSTYTHWNFHRVRTYAYSSLQLVGWKCQTNDGAIWPHRVFFKTLGKLPAAPSRVADSRLYGEGSQNCLDFWSVG